MGPTWGPPGSCRPQVGPMLTPWTLLSENLILTLKQLGNFLNAILFSIIGPIQL